MQLRSGKIIDSVSSTNSPTRSSMHLNRTRDPTYNPSPLEMAKYKVREGVRKRQRDTADKHTEKAVVQVRGVFALFAKDFKNANKSECNRMINKTRILTLMFQYANSISSNTMMHHRMLKLRSSMLKQCAITTEDIKYEIKKAQDEYDTLVGIYKHYEQNVHRSIQDLHNYHMTHFIALQAEIDKFTNAYANRL